MISTIMAAFLCSPVLSRQWNFSRQVGFSDGRGGDKFVKSSQRLLPFSLNKKLNSLYGSKQEIWGNLLISSPFQRLRKNAVT